jgi:hypothetical protein
MDFKGSILPNQPIVTYSFCLFFVSRVYMQGQQKAILHKLVLSCFTIGLVMTCMTYFILKFIN